MGWGGRDGKSIIKNWQKAQSRRQKKGRQARPAFAGCLLNSGY